MAFQISPYQTFISAIQNITSQNTDGFKVMFTLLKTKKSLILPLQ